MPRATAFLLLMVLGFLLPATGLAQLPNYKRAHQQALKRITSKDGKDAIPVLEKLAERASEDPEAHFMMALAHAHGGDVEAATKAAETSLERGLPPGRFVAGPRELLAPLMEMNFGQELTKQFASKPIHGPLVGHVTEDSVHLWVRTAAAATVRMVVEAKDGSLRQVTKAETLAASDFTAVVVVEGLKPSMEYQYGVGLNEEELLRDEAFHFTTPPAAGGQQKFTLAFGGGAGYVPQHERMWKTIDSRKPDMMLLLGDNVYSDQPQSSAMQRYCYYRRQSRPEFRTLTAHTPVYSIWDDHDFGTNDCWGGPEIDSPKWKRPVWNVYRQNWANPAYGGGVKQPGCYYDFVRGDVHFIMLDGRFYRTNPRVEKPSMLGPVQLAWAKETLAASKATFKVICSPVPWDYRTKGKSLDTWNGFQAEREELFSVIAKNKIPGVILMSADRHRSDAWLIERPDSYDLYEFNSSRLTNQHVHGTMQEAIFSYNAKQSFGLVSFDTTAKDPTVTYKVINIDNKEMHELTVKRSQLVAE